MPLREISLLQLIRPSGMYTVRLNWDDTDGKSVRYSAVRGTVTMTQTSGQASRFEPAYARMRPLSNNKVYKVSYDYDRSPVAFAFIALVCLDVPR